MQHSVLHSVQEKSGVAGVQTVATIDHLMWGAPSLAEGIARAEKLFGVEPVAGGSHAGLGTCNALLGLSDDVYLEIIAPDPAQRLDGTFGERLQQLDECALVTWASRCGDLDALSVMAGNAGLRSRGPTLTERLTPDGKNLRWKLLFLSGHSLGNSVPFFIDWMDTPHPSTTAPAAGRLQKLEVITSEVDAMKSLLAQLGLAMDVIEGEFAGLHAVFESSNGLVELSSSKQTGKIRFG